MQFITQHKFVTPVEAGKVASDWQSRGYSCEPYSDPPGRTWKEFIHARNELVTVVQGRLRMTIADVDYDVAPGDEVLIPKGTIHSVSNINDDTTHWLYGYD